jgi:predicted HicB family RNase H-like nuclease
MSESKIMSQYPLKIEKSIKDRAFKQAKRKRQSFNQYIITLIENDLKKL